MKVSSKIILVGCLAFVPILAADGWLSLQREEALFRLDMQRDLAVLGAHLRGIAAAEWERSGDEGVSALLAPARETDPGVACEWRRESPANRSLEEHDDALVWVEPVAVAGRTVGSLALTEPLEPMYTYLRATVARLGLLTVLLILGALLAARLLSDRLIGRRLDRLVTFAAETGAGRLGQRVAVGGRDEITRLGEGLSAMSEALDAARRDAERLNDERLTMLQHLRHADRLSSLGRLAGSVAHELGTPLNVVMGHADRISGGAQSPGEMKASAETIHRQVKRMETTIRDILGFARRVPIEAEEIEVSAVVNSVSGLLQPLAARRNVRLEVDGTLASARVRGREVQLEQALSNLVANALDASPDGGKVVLTLAREERIPKEGGRAQPVIVVRVRDQGPGVDAADVARLFEPFYTSKVAGGGTGLGLWLAEGIVHDHGGSIEIENRSEGGACFAMVLPEAG